VALSCRSLPTSRRLYRLTLLLSVFLLAFMSCKRRNKRVNRRPPSVEKARSMCARGNPKACLYLCLKYEVGGACDQVCRAGEKKACDKSRALSEKAAPRPPSQNSPSWAGGKHQPDTPGRSTPPPSQTWPRFPRGVSSVTARLKAQFLACAKGSSSACAVAAAYIPSPPARLKEMATVHRGMGELCSRDNLTACSWLGQREVAGDAPDLNPLNGPAHLERACTGSGYRAGCTALARLLLSGDLVGADPKRAETLLLKACSNKDPEACFALAVRQADATPAQSRSEAVRSLVRKACRAGHDESCLLEDCAKKPRGRWHQAHALRDSRAAHEFLVTLCTAGNRYACMEKEAWALRGLGVVQALESARKALTRLCKGGETEACVHLGLACLSGFAGSKPELSEAATYLKKACTKGSGVACGKAGIALIYRKQYKEALPLLEQGCQRGSLEACTRLGGLHLQLAGPTPTAFKKATAALSLACDRRQPAGCARLAYMRHLADDPSVAATLPPSRLNPLCNLGYSEACAALAALHERGRLTVRNPSLALALGRTSCGCGMKLGCVVAGEALLVGGPDFSSNLMAAHVYFLKGCSLGLGEACFQLGRMNWEGVGIPVNRPRAFRYLDQACDTLKWKKACTYRKPLTRPVVEPSQPAAPTGQNASQPMQGASEKPKSPTARRPAAP